MNLPNDPREPSRSLAYPLILWPAISLLVVIVGYCLLHGLIPHQIVLHIGPDGDGYGSTLMFILGALLIAFLLFLVGGLLVNGYIKRGHFYGAEKMLSVSLLAGGFGVSAIAACLLLSNVNTQSSSTSEQSIGFSLLGFVCAFIVTALIYARVLPKAKSESF